MTMATYLFFTLLDLAALNAYVLFTECTNTKPDRSDFIKTLAVQLGQEYAVHHSNNLHDNVALCNSIVTNNVTKLAKRGKCYLCNTIACGACCICNKRCCKDHCMKTSVCEQCCENGSNSDMSK